MGRVTDHANRWAGFIAVQIQPQKGGCYNPIAHGCSNAPHRWGGRLPYDSILVGSIKVGSAKVGSVKDGSAKVGSSKGDGGGSAGHFTWR
jgi:hypothetical protein